MLRQSQILDFWPFSMARVAVGWGGKRRRRRRAAMSAPAGVPPPPRPGRRCQRGSLPAGSRLCPHPSTLSEARSRECGIHPTPAFLSPSCRPHPPNSPSQKKKILHHLKKPHILSGCFFLLTSARFASPPLPPSSPSPSLPLSGGKKGHCAND